MNELDDYFGVIHSKSIVDLHFDFNAFGVSHQHHHRHLIAHSAKHFFSSSLYLRCSFISERKTTLSNVSRLQFLRNQTRNDYFDLCSLLCSFVVWHQMYICEPLRVCMCVCVASVYHFDKQLFVVLSIYLLFFLLFFSSSVAIFMVFVQLFRCPQRWQSKSWNCHNSFTPKH